MASVTLIGVLKALAIIASCLVLFLVLGIAALSYWYQRYWPRNRD